MQSPERDRRRRILLNGSMLAVAGTGSLLNRGERPMELVWVVRILTDEEEPETIREWRYDDQPMPLVAGTAWKPPFADVIDIGAPLPPGDYLF